MRKIRNGSHRYRSLIDFEPFESERRTMGNLRNFTKCIFEIKSLMDRATKEKTFVSQTENYV